MIKREEERENDDNTDREIKIMIYKITRKILMIVKTIREITNNDDDKDNNNTNDIDNENLMMIRITTILMRIMIIVLLII